MLSLARHWAYCHHDKDFKVTDEGERVAKEPHTHIIVTFEHEISLKRIREHIGSEANTLGQTLRNTTYDGKESLRGLWRYLIHEGENPEDKHVYDEQERICDDIDYWTRRCDEEARTLFKNESFFEDLTSEEFSFEVMGRKYGRDFIKNSNRYLEYRRQVLSERSYTEEQIREQERAEKWHEIEAFCHENSLDWEEVKTGLYFFATKARSEREREAYFNQIQKTGEES